MNDLGVKPLDSSPSKLSRKLFALNYEEAQKLIDHAKPGREKRIVWIMLMTGIHPKVLSKPDEHNLDIVRGRILVWERTKKEKVKFKDCHWEIPKEYQDEMQAMLKEDTGLHRGSYWLMIHRIGKRAGIDASPLILRHTATVNRLHSGDNRGLRETIGATRRVITDYYGY